MSSADEFFKVWVEFLFVMPSINKFFLLSSLLTIFFTLTNWVGEFEHWAEMYDLHMRVNESALGKQDKTVPQKRAS